METVVRTHIVKIGNSRGIRLPRLFLEQSGLGEEVELELQERQIVIRPARRARDGWEAQFQEMAAHGDDQLLDPDTSTSDWDDEEWTW